MIQTTRLVHHMFIESRRDRVRLTVVNRPHRPNHRTELNKLHRRRKMDRLARTIFISDSCVTCRQIRKFGILQIAPHDSLGCKVPVVEGQMRTRMAESDLGDHDTQDAPIRSFQALQRP